jgi:hypothetical protein
MQIITLRFIVLQYQPHHRCFPLSERCPQFNETRIVLVSDIPPTDALVGVNQARYVFSSYRVTGQFPLDAGSDEMISCGAICRTSRLITFYRLETIHLFTLSKCGTHLIALPWVAIYLPAAIFPREGHVNDIRQSSGTDLIAAMPISRFASYHYVHASANVTCGFTLKPTQPKY